MNESPLLLADAAPVALFEVERALVRRMRALQGDGERPLHFARMSNLVAFCDSRERAAALAAEIGSVVAVHPARVFLILGEIQSPRTNITASIAVRSPGGRYSDVIALHAGGDEVSRLPSAVRGLLVGDLPINVWWASNIPPPFAGPLLRDLSANAQQIIYDSYGWLEPVAAMAVAARWLDEVHREQPGKHWRVGSDLNWRRLKYWRRFLAQSLDATLRDASETVSEVLVEHGPHAVIQAWSLASWLARWLGWRVAEGTVRPGVEIAWTFVARGGDVVVRIRRLAEGPGEIRQVRVRCTLRAGPATLIFRAAGGDHLEASSEGVTISARTLAIRPQGYADLVGRQLSDRERDDAFIESTVTAELLARSILH